MRLTLMHPSRVETRNQEVPRMAKLDRAAAENIPVKKVLADRVCEAAFDSANPALKGQLSAVLRDQLLNQTQRDSLG